MRASAKIFWILGAFFLAVTIAYGLLTGTFDPLGVETVGFPVMVALTGLAFMIGMAMSLAVRKNDLGPSEDMYGEVEADAGVQGSFSPYSWAPLWAAVGAGLCFLGVAAGWWIFAFGVIFAIYGILLWVLEFSRGQHAH